MPSVGTQLALALTALAPIIGKDNIAKVLNFGLKKGGKVKAKRAKKATKPKRMK